MMASTMMRSVVSHRIRGMKVSKVMLIARTQHVSSRCFATSKCIEGQEESTYAQAMYDAWRYDPKSVHRDWSKSFEKYGADAIKLASPVTVEGSAAADGGDKATIISDHQKLQKLIRAFRVRGHSESNVNPLGEFEVTMHKKYDSAIQPEYYGFTAEDLDRKFGLLGDESYQCLFNDPNHVPTLREILAKLERIYCGKMGYQFKYIENKDELLWMQRRIEDENQRAFTTEEKKQIMLRLTESAGFEKFLQRKYTSQKRFGVDGCEVLIPGCIAMLEHAALHGATNAVIGMPHRGRLNVLCNVLQKPLPALFYEFSDHLADDDEGQGDVKYHLGFSTTAKFANGKSMHLSLLANPSHLEAVNPVVHGKARAKQDLLLREGSSDPMKQVLPIIFHGDAAFAGQGVVFECFGLSHLPAYTNGGCIHVVVNNQIGFTTDPRFSRSTEYCTDIGKMVQAPIVHVNGDSVEDVVRVFQMAADYRQTFQKDFIIDLVCYRKFGHNEGDQPFFTQPHMYRVIEKLVPVIEQYASQLKAEGVVDDLWLEEIAAEYDAECTESFNQAQPDSGYKPPQVTTLDSYWKGFRRKVLQSNVTNTGINEDTLKLVGDAVSSYPKGFNVHKALAKVLKARKKTITEKSDIDWATAEAIAFGLEGKPVRLSGQDVERGTFSQRHHVLHDQEVDRKTFVRWIRGVRFTCPVDHCNKLDNVPLEALSKEHGGAQYAVHNSHLSEYAVLGFELGYSQSHPQLLVCWEAQFGDFANTAQCIIDQFITSGEEKWGRQTGLVMLLPHGYEGMGPEHSSCRLERFLQMCNDDESEKPDIHPKDQISKGNFQVVNCTTPANYFHVLRRQVYRDFRKPLVVATPKNLLRHPRARSTFADMSEGTRFLRVIPETDRDIFSGENVEHPDVKRLILCSGKVYYDLLAHREEQGIKDVAIARIEQISPFPHDLVDKHKANFPNADLVFCQEEPKNMGPWSYVRTRIQTALTQSSTQHNVVKPKYVGRKPSASTAAGDKKTHKKEHDKLIAEVFTL